MTAGTTMHRKMALLAGAALLGLAGQPAMAVSLHVTPGQSIAAALQQARPGDTIQVERGQYAEHLLIDKPVILQGLGRPTISGGNTGDVIRIRAHDVQITGFILRDSGSDLGAQNAGIYIEPGADRAVVRDCDLTYDLFGLWIERARDVKVLHNRITGKRDFLSAERGNGIQVFNTDGTQVIGNDISFTRDGVYVDYSRHALFRGNRIHHLRYGTHFMNTYYSVWENNRSYLNRGGLALMEAKNLTVRNNIAWGNSDHGIMLRTLQDSVIENNIVSGNARGFFIYDADYNTLRSNLVSGNRIGVHLAAASGHNTIEGNDFIDNQEQVKFVASRDADIGQKSGNYWSNYTGWDHDGNGIGDVPYEANDVVDRLNWQYPLIKLLLSSPAIQSLRFVARQFPVLRTPSLVDHHPHMKPFHADWRHWIDTEHH